MARRIKKLRGDQLKTAKRELARLKKFGLYRGSARKQPTRYARDLLKKYQDVLRGQAAVVTAPRQKNAREYREVYRTKFRKVVIPTKPGTKFYYNRKTGEIFSYSQQYGHTLRTLFPKHPLTEAEARKYAGRKNVRFVIPIGPPGHRERFTGYADLAQFMNGYKTYKNWQRYVEIEEILDLAALDEDQDEAA